MDQTLTRQSTKPRFLTDYAPTRGLRRFTPLSRPPATPRLADVWHVAAERNPTQSLTLDRPPDIEPDGPLTRDYAHWAALVDEAMGWLHAAGVEPWDRVAIFKANHLDVTALSAAAARLGAVPATLAQTHTPETIRMFLARLERPVLVTDSARLDAAEIDEGTVTELTKRTICVDGEAPRPDLIGLDALRGASAPPARPRRLDEPMVITHTSGTTGPPKLVLHSATSMHALAHVETERWPGVALRSEDTLAFCDPYFHQRVVTGLMAIATATPRLVMLSDPDHDNVRRMLRDHVPSVVETLPNMYLHWEPLTGEPSRLFRDVRLYINSFDAIHTRTIRAFLGASNRRVPIWIQSWSQSEAGAMVIRPYARWSVRRRGRRPPPTQRLGWPLPFVCKARVVDPETEEPLPRGRVGLVEISQPGRCLAYVGEQDRHERKCKGWWWNTGDLGMIGRFGSVRLVDREVDRIPGGSTIELEDVLLDRLPRATEVVVLAVPEAKPLPVVSTVDDLPLDRSEWEKAVADLPDLAQPVHVRWDEIPRTATWKVRRVELRRRLLGEDPVGRGAWT
jgi:acyl-coenzyme A synthetase/AMP-(fatty) acid ligase